jgi:WD40 repeat protein
MYYIRHPICTCSWLGLLLGFCSIPFILNPALAGPPANRRKAIKSGEFKRALPTGAMARLGGESLFVGFQAIDLAYSRDGKRFAALRQNSALRLWGMPSGKDLGQWPEPQPRTFIGYGRAVCFGSNGHCLIVVKDSEAVILETATLRELRRVPLDMKRAFGVALASDGRTVAISGISLHGAANTPVGKIRTFDILTGKLGSQWRVPSTPTRLLFAHAGRTVVSTAGTSVFIHDLASPIPERRLDGPGGNLRALAISSDGESLAAAGDTGQVRLWSTRTWQGIRTFGRSDAAAVYMAFDRKGTRLITGGADGDAWLWDVASGRLLRQWKTGGQRYSGTTFALAPDGKTLAVGVAMRIHLWDIDTGAEQGHQVAGSLIRFSTDGKAVVIAGTSIQRWEPKSERLLRQIPIPTGTLVSSLSHNGLIATLGTRTIALCDSDTGKRMGALVESSARALPAFGPDPWIIASGATTIGIVAQWDCRTGKTIREFRGLDTASARIGWIAWTPDGRYIAAAAPPDQPETRRFVPRPERITQVIAFWDARTGKMSTRFTLHSQNGGTVGISSLTLSPDACLIAGVNTDQSIGLWEVLAARKVRDLPPPAIGRIESLAFSPNSRFLAVGGQDTVSLWDVARGEKVAEFRGHRGAVRGLSFSREGHRLASVGDEGTALIWDVEGALAKAAGQHAPVRATQLLGLWSDLRSHDAATALRAVGELAAAPQIALPFIASHLSPTHAGHADPVKLARLITDLDDKRFAVRESATMQLVDLGDLAERALRKALRARPSAEMQRRIHGVLDAIDQGEPTPAAMQAARAIRVLEQIGTPEAQKVLLDFVKAAGVDPEAQDAHAALRRIADRTQSARKR